MRRYRLQKLCQLTYHCLLNHFSVDNSNWSDPDAVSVELSLWHITLTTKLPITGAQCTREAVSCPVIMFDLFCVLKACFEGTWLHAFKSLCHQLLFSSSLKKIFSFATLFLAIPHTISIGLGSHNVLGVAE